MTDLRHLSREEQKLLADVALLAQNDDREFNAGFSKIGNQSVSALGFASQARATGY